MQNKLKNSLFEYVCGYDIGKEYPYIRDPYFIARLVETKYCDKKFLIYGDGIHTQEFASCLFDKQTILGVIPYIDKDVTFVSCELRFDIVKPAQANWLEYDYILLLGYWSRDAVLSLCGVLRVTMDKLLPVYATPEAILHSKEIAMDKVSNLTFSKPKRLAVITRVERRDIVTSASKALSDYFSLTKVYVSGDSEEQNNYFDNVIKCENDFTLLMSIFELYKFDIVVFFNCGQSDNLLASYIKESIPLESKFVHINYEACLNGLLSVKDTLLGNVFFNANDDIFHLNKNLESELMKSSDGFISHITGDFYNSYISLVAKNPFFTRFFQSSDDFTFHYEEVAKEYVEIVYAGSFFFDYEDNNFVKKAMNIKSAVSSILTHNPNILINLFASQSIGYSVKEAFGCSIANKIKLFDKVPSSKLPKAIAKMDFGLIWFNIDDEIEKIYATAFKSEFYTKFVSYIAAGIPIIIHKKISLLSSIVEDNGLGLSIEDADLFCLQDKIDALDYDALKRSVKNYQDKWLSDMDNHSELVSFFEKILDTQEVG